MGKKIRLQEYINSNYAGAKKPDPRTVISRLKRGEHPGASLVKEGNIFYVEIAAVSNDDWAASIFNKHQNRLAHNVTT